jgi:hypothetical protein
VLGVSVFGGEALPAIAVAQAGKAGVAVLVRMILGDAALAITFVVTVFPIAD